MTTTRVTNPAGDRCLLTANEAMQMSVRRLIDYITYIGGYIPIPPDGRRYTKGELVALAMQAAAHANQEGCTEPPQWTNTFDATNPVELKTLAPPNILFAMRRTLVKPEPSVQGSIKTELSRYSQTTTHKYFKSPSVVQYRSLLGSITIHQLVQSQIVNIENIWPSRTSLLIFKRALQTVGVLPLQSAEGYEKHGDKEKVKVRLNLEKSEGTPLPSAPVICMSPDNINGKPNIIVGTIALRQDLDVIDAVWFKNCVVENNKNQCLDKGQVLVVLEPDYKKLDAIEPNTPKTTGYIQMVKYMDFARQWKEWTNSVTIHMNVSVPSFFIYPDRVWQCHVRRTFAHWSVGSSNPNVILNIAVYTDLFDPLQSFLDDISPSTVPQYTQELAQIIDELTYVMVLNIDGTSNIDPYMPKITIDSFGVVKGNQPHQLILLPKPYLTFSNSMLWTECLRELKLKILNFRPKTSVI